MWSTESRITSLAVAATLLLFASSAWYAYSKGKQSGMQQIQSLWDSEKLQQTHEQAKQVQALSRKVYEAQKDAKQREEVLRRDAAASRAVADGLREQLTQANDHIGTAPASAVAQYARTVNELFASCTRTYREVAERADGHASDAVMLQQAWPANQGSKP